MNETTTPSVETPRRNSGQRVSAKSLANLRPPWKPGESGNLSGRPKKKPVTEAYEKALENPETAHLIAAGIIKAAQKGDVQAAKEIADRLEGKIPQQVGIEGSINISALLLAAFARMRPNGNGNGGSRPR